MKNYINIMEKNKTIDMEIKGTKIEIEELMYEIKCLNQKIMYLNNLKEE